MTPSQILEIIEQNSHSVFGFRAVENKFSLAVGDDVPHSYDWDVENDCSSDSLLPGASAIFICDSPDLDDIEKTLKLMKPYNQSGTQLLLIAGEHAGLGSDKNEILISDGVVLAILN